MDEDEEVLFLLGDLNSFQFRVKKKLSQSAKKSQSDIIQWIRSLPLSSFRLLRRVDISETISPDICSVLQAALITEPKAFEDVIFLKWNLVNGERHIARTRRPQSADNSNIEREFLSGINIIWDGTKVVHIVYPPNSIDMLFQLSEDQCFTTQPELKNPSNFWLNSKVRFSFAQFLGSLLEIHIWSCWNERSRVCPRSKTLSDPRFRTLEELLSQHQVSTSQLTHRIEKCGRNTIKELIVGQFKGTKNVETISLYLQIMKQRILCCWFDSTLDSSPFRINNTHGRDLWVLHHLFSLPHVQTPWDSSDCDIFESLVSVPLFHSFSFYHEFKTRLWENLLADLLMTSLIEDSQPLKNISKKRVNKKKKKKKSSTPKLAPQFAEIQPESAKTKSPSPTFVCLQPADITDDLIESTQTMVCCVQVVDMIVEFALNLIDQLESSRCSDLGSGPFSTQLQSEKSELPHDETCNEQLNSTVSILDSTAPWIFENWALPFASKLYSLNGDVSCPPFTSHEWFSLPLPIDQMHDFVESIDQDAESDDRDSVMFWIRKQIQHDLEDSDVSETPSSHLGHLEPSLENGGPNQIISGNENNSTSDYSVKSLKSLPSSPNTGIAEGATRKHCDWAGVVRNERARSFTEIPRNDLPTDMSVSLKSANPLIGTPEQSGRRRSGSLDPSHSTRSASSSRYLSPDFPPFSSTHGNMPPRPASSSSADRYLTPKSDFSYKHNSLVWTNSPDHSCDETFDEVLEQSSENVSLTSESADIGSDPTNISPTPDSGVSFGIWSQKSQPEFPEAVGVSNNYLPSESLFFSSPVYTALSCSLLRAHSETILLRNIIALQKSLIMTPQSQYILAPSSTVYFPQVPPFYQDQNSFRYGNVDQSGYRGRELEVMSDGGDSHFTKKVGKIAVSGAATMSSLCFHTKRSAMDDAGISSPSLIRCTSIEGYHSLTTSSSFHQSSPAIADTSSKPQVSRAPLTNVIWTASDDYALMKRDWKRKSSAHLTRDTNDVNSIDEELSHQQARLIFRSRRRDHRSESESVLNESSASSPSPLSPDSVFQTLPSRVLPQTPPILHSTVEINPIPKVPVTRGNPKPFPSPSSLPLFLHPLCTMSEHNGGLPSILTREIVAFVAKVDLFDTTWRSVKTTAIDRMRLAVKSLWPRAQVKPFGSYVSGLSLPSSDLDLVICLPKVHREAGPEAAGFLEGRNAIKESWQQNLARCLRTQSWVDVASIKVIANTAVPVIKLKTKMESGYSVSLDVSFEGNIHQGLEANRLNVSLMTEFPALRPIVLVLKQFLSRRGLCESFTGGLSSYALLLISARFLQEHPPMTPLDIGGTLLGLLNFYGNHLQPAVTGISVARRMYFSRNDHSTSIRAPDTSMGAIHQNLTLSSLASMNRRHSYNFHNHQPLDTISSSFKPYKFDPLFIEDPLAFENNVGRNCFRIHQVQKLWSDTYNELVQRIFAIESEGGSSSVCLLELLVGSENV